MCCSLLAAHCLFSLSATCLAYPKFDSALLDPLLSSWLMESIFRLLQLFIILIIYFIIQYKVFRVLSVIVCIYRRVIYCRFDVGYVS